MSPAELERAWEAAVRSALLGTERQPPAASGEGGPEAGPDAPALDRALARLAERSDEARVLGTAGVLSLYRRAGRLPSRDARPLPEPAPEEADRRPPPAAGRLLASMLAGEHAALLPEWLAYAAARGVTVPAELLPALLDAARSPEAREGAAPVLGARGRWLAAQNPAWAWVAVEGASAADGVPEDARGAWETGTADARRVLLRRVRKSDPALGLELVQSTWSADAPKDRAAFLAELEEGLSAADELFVEAALDDRRKEVRRAAADLLSRLPTSRLAARMRERARALLRISLPSGGLMSKLTGAKPAVTAELPAECTKEMARDGVEQKPPQGTGERAWWLLQLLAAVPPAEWSADAPTEAWIDAAGRSDLKSVLLDGWSAAAWRFRDAEWAGALIGAGRWSAWSASHEHRPLTALLPPDAFRAQMARMLASGDRVLSGNSYPIQLLAQSPHPMGAELTRALLARITPGAVAGDYGLREMLRPLAARMDPAAALEVIGGWEQQPRGAWIDLLHVRHALNEAFAS